MPGIGFAFNFKRILDFGWTSEILFFYVLENGAGITDSASRGRTA